MKMINVKPGDLMTYSHALYGYILFIIIEKDWEHNNCYKIFSPKNNKIELYQIDDRNRTFFKKLA